MYFYKGHDWATITLLNNNQQTSTESESIDEVKMYLDARHISASKSIWRIFHYKMHGCFSTVQRLAVHLSQQQHVTFRDDDDLQNIVERANTRLTTLTAWFQENTENIAAREYKYIDFPTHYT